MPRNLDNRIEVVTPVYDAKIKEDLEKVIDYGLRDTMQGRIVDGTGDGEAFRSQEQLYLHYREQLAGDTQASE